MIAVDQQDQELVRRLIEKKVNVNKQDKYGQTAIMLAAGRNFHAAVKMLLSARANLRLVSKSGLTALGFAIDNGNDDCAVLLKKAGAK